jgi:tRNA A37 methylthiotransferase MiaB
MDVQQGIQRESHRAFEGRVLEVLVEGLDRQGRHKSGRSRCSRVVNIAREQGEAAISPGTFVNVRIERGYPNSLLGRITGESESAPSLSNGGYTIPPFEENISSNG